MRKLFTILLFFLSITIFAQANKEQKIQYVNPLIGTSYSTMQTSWIFSEGSEVQGQVIPAVFEPHGMNFWTPQTRNTENKCVAPYYYTDTIFLGFRNSHWINGGCTQDYGSMTITPQFGQLRTENDKKGCRFRHRDEISQPNYYSVLLPDESVKAEMTGKSRTAIFKFTYNRKGKGYIVVTSNNDQGKGYVHSDINQSLIYGSNPVGRIYQSKGESAGFSGHFIVLFNKKPIETGVFKNGAWFCFNVEPNEPIISKVSTSFCDIGGAINNMQKEIPDWDFTSVLNYQTSIWNSYLNKIEVDGNIEDKIKFYTALYHTAFLPHNISDIDGRRPRFDNNSSASTVIVSNSPDYYTDFSMWDTYRALHPLFNIIDRERNGKMMQSLIDMYHEGGWLPIFPCWNSYTSAMIGDHCISAIVDAYIKGVNNFDIQDAYTAMRKNAFEIAKESDYKSGKGRRALKSYLKYGYIPLEDEVLDAYHTNEQVSRTLEYAYDDYCLSIIAKKLGFKKDFIKLEKRSHNYKNVFDPKTGYVQGRYKNKRFLDVDNLTEKTSFITEGAPCHYSWYVPHDPEGLISIMGGNKEYTNRLDSLFVYNHYWHGNEPCHQIAYMYNYAGFAWRTQKTISDIISNEYGIVPGGISGNEDSGQMSAWLVFSSLGFYPVCPGKAEYQIGTPLFPTATINLENGKKFSIKAYNLTKENIYIQSIKYNNKPIEGYTITHDMIMNGGILEFTMGNKPKFI